MKKRTIAWAFALWAFVACPVHASVIVNEIAWMGTTVSGTNEWIELYNEDSGAVDLTGWKILTDYASSSIVLSGTISPHGYFLIERTDDESVQGVSADLVASFGHGLSNEGGSLWLTDTHGIPIDTVIGGKNWMNIGGNNTKKETAQRLGDHWITGTPTPRAVNVQEEHSSNVSGRPIQGESAATSAPVAMSVSRSYPNASKVISPAKIPPAQEPRAAVRDETPSATSSTEKDPASSAAAVLWTGGSASEQDPLARTRWISVFAVLVLVSIAGYIIAKSNVDEPTAADEYAIIEDIIEGNDDLEDIHLRQGKERHLLP